MDEKEERRNRMAAALTVNAILLIVIIAIVLIYQIVEISVLTGRRNDLRDEIEYYETEIDSMEKDIDYYLSEEYLIFKAYEYGYVFGN